MAYVTRLRLEYRWRSPLQLLDEAESVLESSIELSKEEDVEIHRLHMKSYELLEIINISFQLYSEIFHTLSDDDVTSMDFQSFIYLGATIKQALAMLSISYSDIVIRVELHTEA